MEKFNFKPNLKRFGVGVGALMVSLAAYGEGSIVATIVTTIPVRTELVQSLKEHIKELGLLEKESVEKRVMAAVRLPVLTPAAIQAPINWTGKSMDDSLLRLAVVNHQKGPRLAYFVLEANEAREKVFLAESVSVAKVASSYKDLFILAKTGDLYWNKNSSPLEPWVKLASGVHDISLVSPEETKPFVSVFQYSAETANGTFFMVGRHEPWALPGRSPGPAQVERAKGLFCFSPKSRSEIDCRPLGD